MFFSQSIPLRFHISCNLGYLINASQIFLYFNLGSLVFNHWSVYGVYGSFTAQSCTYATGIWITLKIVLSQYNASFRTSGRPFSRWLNLCNSAQLQHFCSNFVFPGVLDIFVYTTTHLPIWEGTFIKQIAFHKKVKCKVIFDSL